MVFTQALEPGEWGECIVNRCTRCGRGVEGSFIQAMGRVYHHDCLQCCVCERPITSSFITNIWGDVYCSQHQQELPSCASCGRIICQKVTGGGGRYKDGRVMCRQCISRAVGYVSEARVAMEGVRGLLAGLGLDTGRKNLPLRLAGRDELRHLSGSSQLAGMTLTTTMMIGPCTNRRIEGILVLYGLPREQFGAVVAHELGHAWLFMNAFPRLAPRVEEGICELAAYLWLEHQTGVEAAFRRGLMMGNEDPVYGEGFKEAYSALKKCSLHELLICVQRSGRLP